MNKIIKINLLKRNIYHLKYDIKNDTKELERNKSFIKNNDTGENLSIKSLIKHLENKIEENTYILYLFENILKQLEIKDIAKEMKPIDEMDDLFNKDH